ncbi:mitochondrial mRNA pseudouridine synthase Trub2-like [Homarus americanus]|uniref:Mitochondrial mRNA pseudouridine synthase Trub2-like n=1 Tax=Homarus americanus TaxID=6706 RepID=A0A8J5KDZ1_HOMAM|nr:mitochondrial mRNA pseudouridine synthase Trub2-like [Homarus americanus]KAG7170636.1 Mitochondrial mRNA pseudouridine synthase Trub2-like [Homarus americanus]
MTKLVHYAPEAWNVLRGVFCVYKPADMTIGFLRRVVISNLCRDLSVLKPRPATPFVSIEGSVGESLVVRKKRNFADDPLVLGPRYQPQDIKLSWALHVDKNISGVCVLGLNSGNKGTHVVRDGRLIRTYTVSGQFGRSTDTHFHDGKVVEKSRYTHVTRGKLLRALMTIQSSHQQSAVNFLGLDPQSQAAYDALSSDGLVRPGSKSPPMIYGLSIVDFNPPDFILEVACINETGVFLKILVHDIGLKLKTSAVCTQMRCIRHGPWTLDHALLRKHWTLEHIINNIGVCHPMVKTITPRTPSLMSIDKVNSENSCTGSEK